MPLYVLGGGKFQVRAYLQKPQVASRIPLMTSTSVCKDEQKQSNPKVKVAKETEKI